MILQGSGDYFNTDCICRIRCIRERDKVSADPIRYTVYLTGHSQGVDVAGEDVPAFQAWLEKNGVKPMAGDKKEQPEPVKKAG